jgi:uncharacterized protein YbaR (Trm112 family)
MASVDQRLLDLLACPACHGHVHLEPAQQAEGDHIVCDACGRRYPVRDGIPIMLVEEAEDGPEPDQTPAEPQADA